MKSRLFYFMVFVITIIQLLPPVLAQTGEDFHVFGLEFAKLLNLGSGLLAISLFVITLLAYRQKKSKRLIYVSIAFFLFALKEFLISLELFVVDLPWVDPQAGVLNFAILLSFFFGILKK